MDSSRLSFKLFIADSDQAKFRLEDFVPVFHSWIQDHAIEDHLLIDVANYAHVQDGPGIVLVAHEANYSIDTRGGRLGLTYQRKQQIQAGFEERLKTVWEATLHAGALLTDRLRFRRDQFEFRICDRLFAPNTTETFEEVKPNLLNLWPGARLKYEPSELELFTVMVTPSQEFRMSPTLS